MNFDNFSLFYYGFDVTELNQYLNFDEGGAPLTATVELGSFTPTDFADKVSVALNNAGALTYFVTFNRVARNFTISTSSGTFSLLVGSGVNTSNVFSMLGFSGDDRTGSNSYTGYSAGSVYEPQYKLQDYISSDNFKKLIKPSINTSATGQVEVIRFGVERFIQMRITFITEILEAGDGQTIKADSNALSSIQDFMSYLIEKKPVEFMWDIGTRASYVKVLLESTEAEKDGTGFILRELYDKGLPGFYDTGKLTFRVLT